TFVAQQLIRRAIAGEDTGEAVRAGELHGDVILVPAFTVRCRGCRSGDGRLGLVDAGSHHVARVADVASLVRHSPRCRRDGGSFVAQQLVRGAVTSETGQAIRAGELHRHVVLVPTMT